MHREARGPHLHVERHTGAPQLTPCFDHRVFVPLWVAPDKSDLRTLHIAGSEDRGEAVPFNFDRAGGAETPPREGGSLTGHDELALTRSPRHPDLSAASVGRDR